MKRWISSVAILMLTLFLAGVAVAQEAGTVSGQVFDLQGNPFPNVPYTISNTEGRNYAGKTDKDGKFTQIGLPDGIYTMTLTNEQIPSGKFSTQFQETASHPEAWVVNLKEIASSAGNSGKVSADKAAFTNMKQHFDAATAAMAEADTLRKSLPTAPADQKAEINAKLATNYQTALTEYTAAEQGVTAKDTVNHSMILGNIGRVDDLTGKYDDAAKAYQSSIDLKPSADVYANLSTSLVNAGAAQRDPAVLQQKTTDAAAACEKAVGIADPATQATISARCYKNMGIVLSNKGHLKEAIGPLQKATTANAKDAQAWFLLGSAYTGTIESKTVGDKEVFDIPPGTADSFQKCIDADPAGPYVPQCKEMIDSVNAMSGGQSTTVGEAPKKNAPKKKN